MKQYCDLPPTKTIRLKQNMLVCGRYDDKIVLCADTEVEYCLLRGVPFLLVSSRGKQTLVNLATSVLTIEMSPVQEQRGQDDEGLEGAGETD